MARIQVGIVAMRTPDGDFMPARPIFRDIESGKISAGIDGTEDRVIGGLAKAFAGEYQRYLEACRRSGVEPD